MEGRNPYTSTQGKNLLLQSSKAWEMKIFKIFGILVLVVIAIAMILMLILPTKQHVERFIIINAPKTEVYQYLSKLENFNKWSAWNRNDSSLRNTITGTDGTIGAVNTWNGDPAISGEGEMKISSLDIDKEIKHEIKFLKPTEMNAKSEFDLDEINGQTRVTWQFDLATPRPWNIFNLFTSMNKRMGKDFEEGLRNVKTAIEKAKPATRVQQYEVIPINFTARRYVSYRQQVPWSEITAFFDQHTPRLYNAIRRAGLSPALPVGLYYNWDEKNQHTEMAVAIPVVEGTIEEDSIQMIDLPASKAIYVDYYGAYDKSMDAYTALDKYVALNGLQKKAPVIEQYVTDTQREKDTSRWRTMIIYLIQ